MTTTTIGTQSVVLVRHGETAWSLSGQHTGSTDIPLTEHGRVVARRLRPIFAGKTFDLVLVSPRSRARETCELAGLGALAIVDPDIREWEYGDYEGLTSVQIEAIRPGWQIFRDGCPGGESPEEVSARVDRVIARVRDTTGNVAVFAHGHILRAFVSRWIGLPVAAGQHFMLSTATVSLLSKYRGESAVKIWNAPIAPP